ncbi:MAG: hypothetical protein ACR2JY_11380 [Chloroflexota bacterium]
MTKAMSAGQTCGPASRRPVPWIGARVTRLLTGVALPEEAVSAAFRLLGLQSSWAQLRFCWRMLLAPSPGMRRLRTRAAQAISDYRAILHAAPHLRSLMKLDFTILLGLYSEALGITWRQALDAGLVEVYCHLAALVDAYDDLLDTPQARLTPLSKDDFLSGDTGRLRQELVAALQVRADGRPAVAALIDDLAAFEAQALAGHLMLDVATGLDAPIEAVVRARAATSGLLLRFAAHLWSVLLALPADLAASSERAGEVFGLVAQFADDVMDWTQDDGVAQNLLGAALRPHPQELAALRTIARNAPGRSIPYGVLARLAPHSLACLNRIRRSVSCYPDHPRYAGLRQFGDDIYETLLPALPAIDFRQLDPIRLAVQAALAEV